MTPPTGTTRNLPLLDGAATGSADDSGCGCGCSGGGGVATAAVAVTTDVQATDEDSHPNRRPNDDNDSHNHNHHNEENDMTATGSTPSYSDTIAVTGMTCGHCVASVTEELQELDGVREVDVDLVAGGTSTVTITSDQPLSDDAVERAVTEAGYQLA